MATHSAPSSRPGSPTPSLGSDSPSRASVSRGSVPALASSKGPFYRADTTFNPSRARHPQRTLSLYRTSGIPPAAPVGFDIPQATTPPFDGKFVHPPFDNLPDSVVLVNEGMNYSVMHKHPTWFLDINDFITLDASPDSAIRYPRDLEPPRPRRQKDLLLRCTFCPRTYAGVNAKSMWTRHVREKHRVVLSKAWSDTATSSRRQSTGKTAATAGVPGLPTDTAAAVRPSEGSKEKSPLTTVPLAVVAKPLPTPVPKGKPGPKPKPKPPKSVSPVKPPKKVSVTRKIVIPAQKPKPKPKPAPPPPFVMPWVRSLSPPPPEGIRPPRMRPLPRKSIIAGQASIEAAATSLVASVGSTPELNQPSAATAVPTTNGGGVDASELDSIASTPRADTTPDDIAATGASTPSAQFFPSRPTKRSRTSY
ncbi:hypothetical protein C8R46DRAFT_90260 [Mycena filopes]|nr:hypothetical protein C8R46DRAFT_90260 [Mycena filopes]